MEISIRTRGGIGVFQLEGQAGFGAHELLREAFRSALDCGRRMFVLDLRRTSALDSMAIGELVACLKRARERGGDVRLVVAAGGSVHEVLQITGLDRAFGIFGEESEAEASFSSGADGDG